MVPNIKNAGALNFQEYVDRLRRPGARAPARPNSRPPISRAPRSRSPIPAPSAPCRSNPRLMPGQGAIIAAGAIDYPGRIPGRRRRDARHARHQQGDDAHLHLRSPHHPGRRIGRVPRQACRRCSMARTASTKRSSITCACRTMPVRWETDRQPLLPGMTAARHAEIAKEAGIMQMINAYRVRGHLIADLDPLGAEPSYHAELDPGNLRPHHLGSGSRIPHRQPGRGHRRRRAQSRRHAARNPGDPAPDLLRQNRLRVHEHPGAGAEALAAAAHGAGKPTTGRSTARRACASCAT